MSQPPAADSDRFEWVPANERYVRKRAPRPASLERRNALGLDRRATRCVPGEGHAEVQAEQGAEGSAEAPADTSTEARTPVSGAAAGDELRRATDRSVDDECADERRTTERRRGGTVARVRPAGFLKRFRQPVIGLGLVGAALPLVAALEDSGASSADPEAGDEAATRTAGVPEDVEEDLAARVGNERELREREQMVRASVGEYGIARDLAEDIYDAAREEGIDPDVAFGLVRTESTFREDAKSHVGALGLTQVMPRTAAWLEPGTTASDLRDRQTNLRLGFRYLDQMIEKYRGNVKLALLAYNRGPGTVDRVLERGGNPDNGYADKVLND